jgi:hypothetical protein
VAVETGGGLAMEMERTNRRRGEGSQVRGFLSLFYMVGITNITAKSSWLFRFTFPAIDLIRLREIMTRSGD